MKSVLEFVRANCEPAGERDKGAIPIIVLWVRYCETTEDKISWEAFRRRLDAAGFRTGYVRDGPIARCCLLGWRLVEREAA